MDAKQIRRPWSKQEDDTLLSLIDKYKDDLHSHWTDIARQMHDRNSKQCRDRYLHHLADGTDKTPYLPSEERALFALQAELGNKWAEIARRLPGRTESSVKNRYYSALRRVQRACGGGTEEASALLAVYAQLQAVRPPRTPSSHGKPSLGVSSSRGHGADSAGRRPQFEDELLKQLEVGVSAAMHGASAAANAEQAARSVSTALQSQWGAIVAERGVWDTAALLAGGGAEGQEGHKQQAIAGVASPSRHASKAPRTSVVTPGPGAIMRKNGRAKLPLAMGAQATPTHSKAPSMAGAAAQSGVHQGGQAHDLPARVWDPTARPLSPLSDLEHPSPCTSPNLAYDGQDTGSSTNLEGSMDTVVMEGAAGTWMAVGAGAGAGSVSSTPVRRHPRDLAVQPSWPTSHPTSAVRSPVPSPTDGTSTSGGKKGKLPTLDRIVAVPVPSSAMAPFGFFPTGARAVPTGVPHPHGQGYTWVPTVVQRRAKPDEWTHAGVAGTKRARQPSVDSYDSEGYDSEEDCEGEGAALPDYPSDTDISTKGSTPQHAPDWSGANQATVSPHVLYGVHRTAASAGAGIPSRTSTALALAFGATALSGESSSTPARFAPVPGAWAGKASHLSSHVHSPMPIPLPAYTMLTPPRGMFYEGRSTAASPASQYTVAGVTHQVTTMRLGAGAGAGATADVSVGEQQAPAADSCWLQVLAAAADV